MEAHAALLESLQRECSQGRPLNTGICRYLEERHGTRFCKRCARMLPVACFKKGQRVYTCMAHKRSPPAPAGQPARDATRAQVIKSMHSMACRDRAVFGQQDMLLSMADMELILALRGTDCPKEAARWSFVPWDPHAPLSNTNYRVLSKVQRRPLLAKWESSGHDRNGYSATLVHMLVQERRWQPAGPPDY